MLLADVNILVYAHKQQTLGHERFKEWLEALINGDEAYGISDLVCSGFIRVVTHPHAFNPPSTTVQALDFIERVREGRACVHVSPGMRHWQIFTGLCRAVGARGNLVPDAYLAALAIESGSEWITTDGDFARFPGLRWRRPFS